MPSNFKQQTKTCDGGLQLQFSPAKVEVRQLQRFKAQVAGLVYSAQRPLNFYISAFTKDLLD